MKKLASLLVIAGILFSCSEDDSDEIVVTPTPTPPAGSANIVINEVAYLSGEVELTNTGDAGMDVSDYFLCLGPGTYIQVGGIIASGDANLAPGAFLVLDYDMPNATGGLGLYRNNSGFGDAANIADFVQWGDAGSARENVAVAAGIWTDGDFVPVLGNANNSIVFDGNGNAASDWAETATVTLGAANVTTAPEAEVRSVVINEVEYLVNDEIELYNNGNVTVDLTDYWMCLGPGQYFRIGDAAMTTIVSGSANLAPGEFLVITPAILQAADDAGGLGLYANNDDFGDAANIRSFVQWGAAGNARESVAVEAGIWNAGGFVPNVPSGGSIAYDGEGLTSDDWDGTGTITLGEANVFTETEVRSVIINEVEYLVNDEIELYNNGNVTVDLSNYWMCLGPGQYFRIGDAAMTTIVSGSANLAPGEFLVITPATLQAADDAGGLGLYANNDGFGNAANIRSFVQWGAAGNARESVAVEAGIWNAGGFVPNVATGSSIAYDGEGLTSDDWEEDTTPSLGSGNN